MPVISKDNHLTSMQKKIFDIKKGNDTNKYIYISISKMWEGWGEG